MYVNVCICIYIYIHINIYICVHVYMHMYIYVYVHICICTYKCIYIYMYTYMYICIYIHVYTYGIYMYITSTYMQRGGLKYDDARPLFEVWEEEGQNRILLLQVTSIHRLYDNVHICLLCAGVCALDYIQMHACSIYTHQRL